MFLGSETLFQPHEENPVAFSFALGTTAFARGEQTEKFSSIFIFPRMEILNFLTSEADGEFPTK